jgi:signal transduction histidine kinase/ABC-type nitrate/sulfonate/bicarbonate transport system substrate-binding protein
LLISKLLKLIIIIIFITTTLSSKELKKVTLQLSWFDQFQFAGYYVAKEKGYYEELGLDVEIKPFQFGIDIPKLVNDSKIDFAIGRETLILEKEENPNIVALYAMFQATPLVLLSTKESQINEISDFKNKKIMTTIDDASEVSLKAMLISNKINLIDLDFIKHSHNIDDLLNKKTDIISAYISKSPYLLHEKNIEYNIFDPKEYGFDLYSDFLFTNKNLINKNNQLVNSFKKASLKGWEYAYSNIEDTADLILNNYNSQNLIKEELVFEGKELRKLSYYKNSTLGSLKKEKVQRVHDLYNLLGLINTPINIDDFIQENYEKENSIIDLSNSNKEYIEENPIVKMCIVPDIRPYSFNDEDKIKGFVIDYFTLIQDMTGLKFSIVKTNSLSQSLEYLKDKKCDILSTATKTKERESFANFTKNYTDIPFVLITNAKASFVDDISVLKNKTISLVKSYASSNEIKKLYPDINFVMVESLDEGLKKVEDDLHYGHIDLLYASWYKIHSNNLTKLRVSARLDYTLPISIAVRKDYYELYDILNIAVNKIKASKVEQLLQRWITINSKEQTDYSFIWKIVLIVLIVFLAILYRQKILREVNKNLKSKVEEKNRELILINEQLEERIKYEVNKNLKKDRILSQQSKMISMGQMIENIAHQWRQPLSLITTSASGIKIKHELNMLDDDYLKESLRNIINTSNYLSDTIDDFRYFFEPEKKENEFLINDCILKCIDLVRGSFSSRDIKVKIQTDENIKIKSFERELIQVFINILNNSKDAFTKDMELKVILIEIYKKDKKAIIEIKDNANGIDEKILEKIYEPYFTTKHKSQGTGIGLYMCQEIITKHLGGSIETTNTEFTYENKICKGALTTITLDAI